jgi:hypothetical protein
MKPFCVPRNRYSELTSLLVIFLLSAGSVALTSISCVGVQQPVWSNASLRGSFGVATTLKPYVKFAGGPHLGIGRLTFDGVGSFSGKQTYEGERDKLSGTYQIEPDGTGVAHLTSIAPDGTVTQSDYTLKIENRDKLIAVPYGLPVTADWVSSDYLIQNGQPAFISVLTRLQAPSGGPRSAGTMGTFVQE